MPAAHPQSIIIIDFGGQYAHLIGNRVRRLGAYSEIRPAETQASELKHAAGIILSGGPQSVYEAGSPQADKKIFDLGIPILGICYGHQWIAHMLGGTVQPGTTKEYGPTYITIDGDGGVLLSDLEKEFLVWMSHGDTVTAMPEGFRRTASSPDCEIAAMEHAGRGIFGVQFHVEVTHTEFGMSILSKFVKRCHPAPWSVRSERRRIEERIRSEVGERNVFMLVSGGVDSTVTFTLLNEVLGANRVQGLLIDTGFMRKNEIQDIERAFFRLGITNLRTEDASEEFFARLKDVYDPEEKRHIIGDTFLAVQKRIFEEMHLSGEWVLGQGTIYPDTIETGGTKHADTIKTHHNRVLAIQQMIEKGLVVEPLKELYKDEVRILGGELGLPHELVWRHPFPGPGLAVRILCAKEASPLPHEERFGIQSDLYEFRVLPVQSVGVQGDARTYRHALIVFMERTFSDLRSLYGLATSITNTQPEINRVLLCTSHPKPVPFAFTPASLTRERVRLLQEADAVVEQDLRDAGFMANIWQCPVVLLPLGEKLHMQSIVLRPVTSQEAMTASSAHLPADFLERLTGKLLALPGIDMVFLDLTNKPPATIEWE